MIAKWLLKGIMIGSFISRVLILVLGYAYPAYECYKTLELNKPEIEQLRFWCQYWILVALLAIAERFGDIFFSWLPFYCEAKLGLYLYLWYPNTRGATYVYETYFGPYIAKHETEIDRNLLEFRARAADVAQMSLQTAAGYFQTSFGEMLKYAIVTMQAPILRSSKQTQQPQEEPQAPRSPSLAHQPAATDREPHGEARTAGTGSSDIASVQLPASPVQTRELVPETETATSETAPKEAEEHLQLQTSNSEAAKDSNSQPLESAIDEAIDAAANGLRKRVAAAAVHPV